MNYLCYQTHLSINDNLKHSNLNSAKTHYNTVWQTLALSSVGDRLAALMASH